MLPETLRIHHLAKVMKVSPDDLCGLAENPRIAFHKPKMRPIGSKMRLITAPRWAWKIHYEWLSIFLRKEFPIHPAAHGSVPERSPFTAGHCHIGHGHLLCRDVKNAFPSVIGDRFYLQLLALGFEREVARLVTKLLLPDGYIPQGGPASNAAIDLFFYRIDCDISRELSVYGARYTRFTDNLDTSFPNAAHQSKVAAVIDSHLSRLGLCINTKKLDQNGWQPAGAEQILCGVRVDSAAGTQLPSVILADLRRNCDALYRGALSVAPHSLIGLASRRRSIQGWLNQAGQADIAPMRELQGRIRQVDFIVRAALKKNAIYPTCEWYVKGTHVDMAAELAGTWSRRRMPRIMAVA
jgi:hypothetical protein